MSRKGAPPTLAIRTGQPVGPLRLRSFLSARWQWIFFGQIAAVLGTLALVKVAAVASTPGIFGRFALILAVGWGINAILFAPIAGWALRYYQEAREARRLRAYYHTLVFALLCASFLATVITGVAVLLLKGGLHRMHITPAMMGIALVMGLSISYSDAAIAVAHAAFFRRSAAVFVVLSSWIRVLAVGVVYVAGATSAQAFGLALGLAVLLLLPVQVWNLRRNEDSEEGGSGIDISYRASLKDYSVPLFLWGIPGYVLGFGDRLLLAYFTNPATVGIYAAMTAATINLTNAASSAANRVLEPTLFAASGSAKDATRVRPAVRMVNLTTGLIAPLALPFVGLYFVWPKAIITLFASGSYHRDSQYLWILLLASVIYLASQQLVYQGFILKKPGVYVPLKYFHAAILATGLVLTIPRYGLRGMILTLLAAHLLQLILVALTNRYRLRLPS